MKKLILILLLVISTAVSISSQETNRHFSHNGHFYFDYPADWAKVNYIIVDNYLSQYGKVDLLNYDVVLAPKESEPFFSNNYLIVILNKFDSLTDQQVKSTLNEMFINFDRRVNYTDNDNILEDIINKVPNYNADKKIAAILTNIEMPNGSKKKNLILFKFYNKGVASFYGFCPDSNYSKAQSIFMEAFNSFDTLNFDSLLPKENLKLADIDVEAITKGKDSGSNQSTFLFIIIAALGLIIVLVVINKKKKNLNK